jgi:hypothetical protein
MLCYSVLPMRLWGYCGFFILFILVSFQIRGIAETNSVQFLHRKATQETQKEAFLFAKTAIEALVLANEAKELVAKTSDDEGKSISTLEAMTQSRKAINKFRQAKTILEPFSKSENEGIKASLLSFNFIFLSLTNGFTQAIDTHEKVAGASTQKELAAIAKEASIWAAQVDEAWKLFLVAIGEVSHTLVDDRRLIDGKVNYLRITTKEREELISMIVVHFGDSIKKGPVGGQHSTTASAAILYEFLKSPWKSSDSN